MKTFSDRSKIHDEVAIPYTVMRLEEIGCTTVITQGHEYDKPELRQLLAQRHDTVSLMKRFKPDLIAIKDDEILFCEVKWTQTKQNNYAVEFESYLSIKEHRNKGLAYYSFLEIDLNKAEFGVSRICDVNDIPFPRLIFLPTRSDYRKTIERIMRDFPEIHVELIEHQSGSGTAFFLISKNAFYLLEWEEFFKDKMIQGELPLEP